MQMLSKIHHAAQQAQQCKVKVEGIPLRQSEAKMKPKQGLTEQVQAKTSSAPVVGSKVLVALKDGRVIHKAGTGMKGIQRPVIRNMCALGACRDWDSARGCRC